MGCAVSQAILSQRATLRARASYVLLTWVEEVMKKPASKLTASEIDALLKIELKSQDIDAKLQATAIQTAPLLEIINRAKELNHSISTTPEDIIMTNLAKEIESGDFSYNFEEVEESLLNSDQPQDQPQDQPDAEDKPQDPFGFL